MKVKQLISILLSCDSDVHCCKKTYVLSERAAWFFRWDTLLCAMCLTVDFML